MGKLNSLIHDPDRPVQVTYAVLLLYISLAIGIVTMFFLQPWVQYLILGVCMASMATLYKFIVDINKPYEGLWIVKPSPFEKLHARLLAVELVYDDFEKSGNIRETIQVYKNDPFRVILCSPPARHRWPAKASIADSDVVRQQRREKGESSTWSFKALREGETWVSMKLEHPDDVDEAKEWAFCLTVAVRDQERSRQP